MKSNPDALDALASGDCVVFLSDGETWSTGSGVKVLYPNNDSGAAPYRVVRLKDLINHYMNNPPPIEVRTRWPLGERQG